MTIVKPYKEIEDEILNLLLIFESLTEDQVHSFIKDVLGIKNKNTRSKYIERLVRSKKVTRKNNLLLIGIMQHPNYENIKIFYGILNIKAKIKAISKGYFPNDYVVIDEENNIYKVIYISNNREDTKITFDNNTKYNDALIPYIVYINGESDELLSSNEPNSTYYLCEGEISFPINEPPKLNVIKVIKEREC